MAALNDKQSRELCRKIEQYILKSGYFIFDTDDWSGLHIDYKPVIHGKNYEYADYTEITVMLDCYKVTDKLQVKYNFVKSVYAGRTGDSYRVYYKREDGEKDGGRQYSMDEAAEFIANRFIGLVEDRIMDNQSNLSPWNTGVLAMGDDDKFLRTVWHYDIEQLQSLEAKTVKDLDMCKSSLRGRRTVLHPLWKGDKLDLEWRLKCIRGIIKDKKADNDYIPEYYQ